MWGTSSPEDKLAGDLGNVIGATSNGDRRSDFFYSRKISAGQFGTFATISAMSRHMQRSKNLSLYDLVGALLENPRHVDAERLGGSEIDH
jgi:hypothetical protein